jgi:small conductance mechanosensitive channel
LAAEESAAFGTSSEWQEKILDPPQVLGVQGVTATGVTIRVVVKTAVGNNAPVARALRGQITERLRREGVAWVVAPAEATPAVASASASASVDEEAEP